MTSTVQAREGSRPERPSASETRATGDVAAARSPRVTVFERSLEQRLAALERANAIRVARAVLKRAVKAGGVDPVEIIRRPPDFADGMHVTTFLRAVPKLGQVRAWRLMRVAQISESKTLGGMSKRQRAELARLLELQLEWWCR